MNTRSLLLAVAFGLAGLSGLIHILLGLNGTLEALSHGGSIALALTYLLAGSLVVVLLGLFAEEKMAPQPLYLLGATLMFGYVLAYADVHAFGLFESVTGVDLHDHGHGHDDHGHDHNGHNGHNGHDHSHDGPAVQVVLEHLLEDTLALVTKTTETIAGVAFVTLIALER